MEKTAEQVIISAMRPVGLYTAARQLTAAEISLGLECLNLVLDSSEVDMALIYDTPQIAHTLVAGDGEYTIGLTGADIASQPPHSIVSAYVTDGAGTDFGIRIITPADYDRFSTKTNRGRPEYLALEDAHPIKTIKLYYVPDVVYTLNMRVRVQADTVANKDVSIDVPGGHHAFLMHETAALIANARGFELSNDVKRDRRAIHAKVLAKNVLKPTMIPDILPAGSKGFSTGNINGD